jgi:uncharacterized protein (DUF983 family)
MQCGASKSENEKTIKSMIKKPNRWLSIFLYKCPRCRQGKMYEQKYLWPLKSMMKMPKHCEVCGQKTELESGFFFGTGYVSYALSVAFLIGYFAAFHLLFGLSIQQEQTIINCLISAIVFLILIQPWMMRFSRILYLNLFVSYDSNWNNPEKKDT